MLIDFIIILFILLFIFTILKIFEIRIISPRLKILLKIDKITKVTEELTKDNFQRAKELKTLIFNMHEKIIEINKHLDGIISKEQFDQALKHKYNSMPRYTIPENEPDGGENTSQEDTLINQENFLNTRLPNYED